MLILITGGIKSGKSWRALEIIKNEWACRRKDAGAGAPLTDGLLQVSFIATAEALDEEMRRRIAKHREERAALAASSGCEFTLIEEPLELDRAIAGAGGRALVDCIPLWINNLVYYKREDDFDRILGSFLQNVNDCIVVTNETGMGNVPFDKDTRSYNILLAEANRKIALAADRVELMVCGIPLRVK
jgi:adenosylcobinamide kinase/adenosylcobinamide-phosphate guanylyltransferase